MTGRNTRQAGSTSTPPCLRLGDAEGSYSRGVINCQNAIDPIAVSDLTTWVRRGLGRLHTDHGLLSTSGPRSIAATMRFFNFS